MSDELSPSWLPVLEEITSPIPPTPSTYSFFDALKLALDGRKITRLEWGSNEDYGLMQDGYLKIFTNGEIQNWIVSEADINSTDWVTLPEPTKES